MSDSTNLTLKLSAPELVELVSRGFGSEQPLFSIEELRPGAVRVCIPYRRFMQRPGDVISGPALFSAADTAMYVLVLAHLGPALMAVTSTLTINFLSKGALRDIHAEAQLLKLGLSSP